MPQDLPERSVVVDSHQHFWDLEAVDYPWLTPEHGALYRSYGVADLEPELDACGIDATVLVQSADSAEDTASMLALATRYERFAAVVGWVPLTDPVAAERALDDYADEPRLVGVRHLIHDEPDPDWLLQPAVLDSLGLLADRGLTFDVVAVQPRHLEHVPVIAARHPGLRLVVDHLAKPPVKQGGWQPWADLLAAAAQHPQVHAKVSGLTTAADLESWTAEDLQRYVDHAVEVFGPDRLMYGGDWPIVVLAGGYRRNWEATMTVLDDLSGPERARVLGGTAVEFYGLAGLLGTPSRRD